jgi:hypothetical protein
MENLIFKQQIMNEIYNKLNKQIANAKPAPSFTPALIGRQVVFTISKETGLVGMRTGAPT